jgi:hypothetical protein
MNLCFSDFFFQPRRRPFSCISPLSLLFLILFAAVAYSNPLLLIINNDTIKTSEDTIVVYPDSAVTITYGCNDKTVPNPGVTYGWSKAVDTVFIENGFIFKPKKEDLNKTIIFKIALVSGG